MTHFITQLINWIIANKDTLLPLVGGAAGLSVLAQGILHKINVKWGISSKAFAYTLVQVLTIIASVSAYIISGSNIAIVYPWLATIAAFVHRYAVSPYYTKKVLPYLTFLSENSVQPTISQYLSPQTPIEPPDVTETTIPPSFVS